MLSPYRALDLATGGCCLCGRVLADLGADVIKVEPPGGDPTRRTGPFVGDAPDPEKSLFWFAYNASKRGITLNMEHPEGQRLLRRLVSSADFLIESFPPGYLDSLGLGYQALKELNPWLIMASITPFGQTGPHRDYKGPDIVGMAMSGQMYATGDPQRPPLRIGFPQAYLHAAMEAAVGIMLALHCRERTGEGQHVDVSMQASLLLTSGSGIPTWDTAGKVLKRAGNYRAGLGGSTLIRQLWPCQDGYIAFAIVGGPSGARSSRPLVQWLDSEGMADEFLRNLDWDTFNLSTTPQPVMDRIEEQVGRFFMGHTKAELYQGAVDRHIMLYPLATPKDILESPQLQARGFWVEVEHPELGCRITYPGPFMKSTEADSAIGRRAPLIGEHNREVYEELGLTAAEVVTLKGSGAI